jgi:hypothetical protein
MFSIKWGSVCHVCKNPVNVYCTLVTFDYDFIVALLNYATIKPFDLSDNYLFYKFIGTKYMHVCRCCYKNTRNAKNIARDIFIHSKKNTYKKSKSKTVSEIFEYFSDLNSFRVRKDRSDYELKFNQLTKHPIPGLLFMV